MRGIQFNQKWTGEDEAYDWMSRIGCLIHPNGEVMKTPNDKAVTNQSHCESRRTVKDISGQSSHALLRRGRPVTANSHTVPFTLSDHTWKLFALAIFYSIPSRSCCSPTLPSFVFVILSSRSVLLVEARQRDTGSADRSGQVAVCYWGCWSDGWASLACRCHKSKRPSQTAPLLPACQDVHQHWHFVTPAQFFSSSVGPHLSF